MNSPLLEIKLFGVCVVRSVEAGGFQLNGAKHKALFALLSTSPLGVRTRAFLQEALWGRSCYDTGHQSLRRALSDIKRIMGPAFARLVILKHSEIGLDLSLVRFVGGPADGEFLEGCGIREPIYREWLNKIRDDPSKLPAHHFHSLQRPPARAKGLEGALVAVLPLRAIGEEAAFSLYGDWTAEEICRSLSRSRLFGVISYLSTRAALRRADPMTVVRDLLKADYCMSGCIRRIDDRIVVDADFIDAHTGRIVWTRRFAAQTSRYFLDAQAGVDAIVHAVGLAIANEAMSHVSGRLITDIEDHRLLVAGIGLMHRPRREEFAQAYDLLQEAARRAPESSETHAWLAQWYAFKVFKGWSEDIALDTQRACEATSRGLDINPVNALCLTVDGYVNNNLLKRMDLAAPRYDAALRYNPNESLAWLLKGALLAFQDRGEEAVEAAEQANRLSPVDPFGYFYDSLSATAYFARGDYDKALLYSQRSLKVNPGHISTVRAKVSALYYLGRYEECRAAAREMMALSPDFTIDSYVESHPAGGSDVGRRAIEALRAAGVP